MLGHAAEVTAFYRLKPGLHTLCSCVLPAEAGTPYLTTPTPLRRPGDRLRPRMLRHRECAPQSARRPSQAIARACDRARPALSEYLAAKCAPPLTHPETIGDGCAVV